MSSSLKKRLKLLIRAKTAQALISFTYRFYYTSLDNYAVDQAIDGEEKSDTVNNDGCKH